jgi:methylmalonyl-CoA mutase N-terminal domain/subunit
MDEALWLPTEKSVRVALRTQQIIANESGAADSVDPLGGSYLVEYLTDEICSRAMDYIQKIDDMGGALSAIERGFMQNEIQDSAYRYQKAVETCEQVVVGVNAFKTDETIQLERLMVNPAIEQNQRTRLEKLRAGRDAAKAGELMTRLDSAARSDEKLMPLIIECVENDLTLGEICGVLRKTWGEYQAPAWS